MIIQSRYTLPSQPWAIIKLVPNRFARLAISYAVFVWVIDKKEQLKNKNSNKKLKNKNVKFFLYTNIIIFKNSILKKIVFIKIVTDNVLH